MFLCYSYNSSNWWASATTLTTKCILLPIPLLFFIVSSRWSILNVTLCTLRTHDFFLCVIWWTWTLHFSVIEHASMHLCLLYMLALPGTDCEDWSTHSHIHTFKHWTMKASPVCHQIFIVLLGTRWRVGQLCGNHHNCFTCWSITHCTQWVQMEHYVERQDEVNQCPQGEDFHHDTQSPYRYACPVYHITWYH